MQLVLSCAMQSRDKFMNISADQGAMTVQRALFSSTAAGSNSADVAATWITTVVVLRPLPLRIAHSCTGNASQPQPPSHLSNMRHGASLIVVHLQPMRSASHPGRGHLVAGVRPQKGMNWSGRRAHWRACIAIASL